jgi:hypothetical protein
MTNHTSTHSYSNLKEHQRRISIHAQYTMNLDEKQLHLLNI